VRWLVAVSTYESFAIARGEEVNEVEQMTKSRNPTAGTVRIELGVNPEVLRFKGAVF